MDNKSEIANVFVRMSAVLVAILVAFVEILEVLVAISVVFCVILDFILESGTQFTPSYNKTSFIIGNVEVVSTSPQSLITKFVIGFVA